MAKVDHITGENIERFRGVIDFYLYAGKIPVARAWPKKLTPPYTMLQEEAMAVFSLASKQMWRLEPSILTAWKIGSEGAREQWTDTFKGLAMKYWKLTKGFPLIALNYTLTEVAGNIRVVWKILDIELTEGNPETIYNLQTDLITRSEIIDTEEPIYFTLLDDLNIRQIAPYILLV